MTIAIYPGSFNPWHQGHDDILKKALQCFDQVIIAVGINPDKTATDIKERILDVKDAMTNYSDDDVPIENVLVRQMDGLLVDFVSEIQKEFRKEEVKAIVRGLRNGDDLQYEMNQQYWNEDFGLEVPITYFICDRKFAHISSSMLRALNKFMAR